MNAKANNTKEKVRQLQRKLYRTAKKGKRRFHALYDKVYREDILMESWKRVKAKKGAGGIDGQSIEDVERYGVEKFLKETGEMLKENRYKAPPVKRTFIDKSDGSKRPLGIPTVRDRVVQMATKLVIEPIFDADFMDCSYGFRPKRSNKMALEAVRKACNNKGYYVIDGDIKSYYDNIKHEKLILLLEQRLSDKRILKLLKNWLKAGVMIEDRWEETTMGSAQGGVISPLCGNIYLNVLDKMWEKYGKQYGKLVRYADDIVIICKNKKNANTAMKLLKVVMKKLELELHREKTKIVSMWDGKEGFDFLGMHHRYMERALSNGRKYRTTYQYPSRKAMQNMRNEVKELLGKRALINKSMKELIKLINPKIIGWRNYYCVPTSKKWMNSIEWYVIRRYTIWYNNKHQIRFKMCNIGKVRSMLLKEGLKRLVI